MRTKKCENCGMRAYEQKNGVYVCKYCQTVYEEEPKSESALQTILRFTERQMDKRREEKVARRKRQEAEENKQRELIRKYWWVYVLFVAGLIALSIVMAILEKQGII